MSTRRKTAKVAEEGGEEKKTTVEVKPARVSTRARATATATAVATASLPPVQEQQVAADHSSLNNVTVSSLTSAPEVAAKSTLGKRKQTVSFENNNIASTTSATTATTADIVEETGGKTEKKVVIVDYMKHASQKTKQRRATSTARKEQVGVEQQMQMSKDMRAMVNAESGGGGGGGDERDAKRPKTVAVNESLLPFIIEDSSSAQSGNDTEAQGDDDTGNEVSDVDVGDGPADYFRKKFASDARRRQEAQRQELETRKEKRDAFMATRPMFITQREDRAPSPEPMLREELEAQLREQGVDEEAIVQRLQEFDRAESEPVLPEAQQEQQQQQQHDKDEDVDDKKAMPPPPPRPRPLQGKKREEKEPSSSMFLSAMVKEPVKERKEESNASAAGDALVHITGSDQIKKRDYSIYSDHRFKDVHFESDKLAEEQLIQQMIGALAAREKVSTAAAEEMLVSRGYGKRALTMESFDLRKQTYGKSNYPTSTRVRCRYDHHPFKGIPILIPIKYYEDKNILTVFPNICFCSFSCALAFLEREAPSTMRRRDRVQMLHFMARKFFGLSDHIRAAPFLEQHIDYGGRLTTEQWRALSTTHCSFIQYPLAVSVPCTIITEVTILQKLDRNLMASITKRTADEHEKAIPEKPEYGEDDAQGAYKRDQKEGKGRPLKRRTLKDDSGSMVTLDKTFLDNVVKSAKTTQGGAKAAPPTGIQALMGIKTVTK